MLSLVNRSSLAVLLALGLLLSCSFPAAAALPAEPEARAQVIGQPTALVVEPASIDLAGPHSMQQIVVTGKYADGTVRDLTPFCELTAETANVINIAPGGFLLPRQNGSTKIIVKAGNQSVAVPVAVKDFDQPQPLSFRRHFIAALNVGGCNMGACHGTPSGKGGFRLSLRGYDPPADYIQLTRDVLGRRTDRIDPDASLILQKGLGKVPHEGGQRFQANSIPALTMRAWLDQGLRDDAADLPPLKKIEVLPGSGRVLNAPAKWQQLAVLAHYADGTVRDVTRLTVFTSSDDAVAKVGGPSGSLAPGLVEFGQTGEVAILCRYLDEMQAVRLTYLETKKDFVWSNPPEHNYVDKHVFAKLKMLGILPSELCTDQEFVRRAYLDLCGILPRPEEVKAFLASTDKDKRAKLIDALLDRPEYADYWTLKWSDVLRSSRKTIQMKGVHVYQQWLRLNIAANTPFDQMTRELITASGSTFANPPANFYRIARDPQNLAETTAQLFFGIRMQCAKCHNHPFERWTQDDYYSMAAFFARVKQKPDALEGSADKKTPGAEVIYTDRGGEVVQPRTNKTMPPKFLGGGVAPVKPGQDRRESLAEWLTAGNNPFFAKSVVNRIWYHLNARGIVDPVDDFRDSNPSANDELLDALAKDFVEKKFDVKHVIRTIMNSRTYQLSAQTNESNKEDNKYFSHAVTKQLPAETLLDAICAATEVPEKFAGLPAGTRAVQLPDGEINHVFLKTFGQPGRELACECEREGDSNLAQALQLINGPTINDKMRAANNRVGRMLAKKAPDLEILEELYLATLSRPPLEGEVKASLDHLNKAIERGKTPQEQEVNRRKAWEDVQWALLNSKEFLFRH
jgi:hypothetical protein